MWKNTKRKNVVNVEKSKRHVDNRKSGMVAYSAEKGITVATVSPLPSVNYHRENQAKNAQKNE